MLPKVTCFPHTPMRPHLNNTVREIIHTAVLKGRILTGLMLTPLAFFFGKDQNFPLFLIVKLPIFYAVRVDAMRSIEHAT